MQAEGVTPGKADKCPEFAPAMRIVLVQNTLNIAKKLSVLLETVCLSKSFIKQCEQFQIPMCMGCFLQTMSMKI